jgi:DNA polymerase-4
MIQDRAIVHMDLDTFFVSCERLLDSRLNKRPIIIGGTSDRGVVSACSYETRGFGVHSGMPMRMARNLCPEAIIIRGNSTNYSKFSNVVTDIIQENVPIYEKTSIDEFYMDLTGMDKFFGCLKLATELRQKIIKETGLPISFGLSKNKTVSKIATGEAKPNNQLNIDFGNEKPFLAPLSVKKIPMVGDKTYQTLRNLGVSIIETIQQMPLELMEKVFGKHGIDMWKKASGIDNTPVIQYNGRKSISTERTFGKDTIDVAKLKTIITAMAENLAFQLRNGNKLTGCISVKIRYSDFNTYSLQSKVAYTAADHIIIPGILELFNRLYSRRILVRLIGIKCSKLIGGTYQYNLFEDNTKYYNLYNAMDSLRNRYGERSIIKASGLGAKTIGRMDSPFNGGSPTLLANRKS